MELATLWLLNFWLRWANSYLAGTEGTYLVTQLQMCYPRVLARLIQYDFDLTSWEDASSVTQTTRRQQTGFRLTERDVRAVNQ